MQSIGIIVKTTSFMISVDSFKCRTYWTLKQTWQENSPEIERLETIMRECSQCFPSGGTVVLNTADLRIMRPKTAVEFLQLFHTFLHNHEVQALAHVGDPHNIVLKMQFQRVLRELDNADELLHKSFLKTEEAEEWLDLMVMPRSRKIIPQGFVGLRAMSIPN